MPAPAAKPDLWTLVRQPGGIVAATLFDAVLADADRAPLEYRDRWLINEALDAIETHWGVRVLEDRLQHSTHHDALVRIRGETFERVGWPSLRTHVMTEDPNQLIRRLLDELGRGIRRPARITIGGSSALMLSELLVRPTEDIDVVDELPEAIRTEYALVDRLAADYKLRMTHFASHYLPDGWANRVQSLGIFHRLTARIVDPIDVLTGKFFTRRPKDFNDIKTAWPRIDPERLRNRLATATTTYRQDAARTAYATERWAILTGDEALPD